jgi:isopropylmalate/homocitrate/citramalate synthase
MFDVPAGIDGERLRRELILDEEHGSWLTGRLNRSSAIAPSPRQSSVIIHDDTLRSGANTPGVYATTKQKLKLAANLEAAGVSEVEAGYASIPDHLDFIRQLRDSGTTLRISGHYDYYDPGWEDRIDRGVEAGTEIVNMIAMTGYLMPLALHPHLTGDAILERMYEAAVYSKATGAFTCVGALATTLPAFEAAIRTAAAAKADRFYIYDTRGWHTPPVMAFLTRFVRDIVGDDMEIAIHCHDDFGMATANTVEAVVAGANSIDVTLLSTGHRCGNAALEQCVAALEVIYGIDTGVDLGAIRKLCDVVAAEYGVPIHANAPIVGAHAYTYGGAHTRALLDGHWFMWENIKAEDVGQHRNVVFGATSLQRTSANPVTAKIKAMGLTPSDEQVEAIFSDLAAIVSREREANVAEMEDIIRTHCGPGATAAAEA